MNATAVVYASKMGSTRHAAEHIARVTEADIFDLKKSVPDISSYNRVIIGSGVYAGKISKNVKGFIEKNEKELKGKDVHLFITCMFSGEKAEEQLKNITGTMTFLSSKAYFSKVKKDPTLSDVDKFIEDLED